jgi:hypothetical protein
MRARRWDMMIFHAPCRFLANSSSKHLYLGMNKANGRNPERWRNMEEGAQFFRELLDPDDDIGIPYVAGENPVMLMVAAEIIGRRAMQFLQPWQFGMWETKKTGIWSKRLPPLVVPYPRLDDARRALGKMPWDKPEEKVWKMGPSADRQKERSRFFPPIGDAMADQWGSLIL